jgi:hypothetical protein
MRQVMVRYKVKPDRVAENEELVRADTADGRSPLTDVEAFKRFQKDIEDRVEEGPMVTEVSQVGSYRS